MKLKNVPYPLVQLPSRTELLLYLIKEDLKSRRFFDGLRELGLDDAYYQSELGQLILAYAHLDTEDNATQDFYYALLGRYSQHLEPNNDSLMNHALQAYNELMKRVSETNTSSFTPQTLDRST